MSKLPGDFGDSNKKFDPAEMQRRIDQMKAEGKMPSMEQFAQVMGMIREEWHKGTFDQVADSASRRPWGRPRRTAAAGGRDEHEVGTGGDGPTGPAGEIDRWILL